MKAVETFVLAAALLSTCTEALTFQKRAGGPARVMSVPIQRKPVSNPLERDRLRRRDGTVKASLDNQVYFYANL